MPVLDELCFEVDDKHIISVNANTFVADYDGFLLVFSTLVLQQIKVTVSDIKLVLPVDKIPRILIRIMDTDTKQIVSEFLHSLVGQHVEVILITKDVLNVCNLLLIIEVYFLASLHIYVENVLRRCHYELCLILTEDTKQWLIHKNVCHRVDGLALLIDVSVIKSEEFNHCEEEELVGVTLVEGKLDASIMKLKVTYDFLDKLILLVSLIDDNMANLGLLLNLFLTEAES